MQIVYIVTSGAYSDYRIDALFSNRESAEKYIQRRKEIATDEDGYCSYDDAKIEIYTLDSSAEFVAESGWNFYGFYFAAGSADVKIDSEPYTKREILYSYDGKSVEGVVMARDEQHAAKIAMEKRSLLLASR